MKFTYDNKQYKITFSHPQREVDIPGVGSRIQRSSVAKIFEVLPGAIRDPKQAPVAQGSVTCNYKDQFIHAVGRKLALEVALDGFGRDFRTAAWTAYLNRNNPLWIYAQTQTATR